MGGLGALLTGAGDAAAQAQAQKYLSALSGYLVTANAALPDQIGGVADRPRPAQRARRPGTARAAAARAPAAGARLAPPGRAARA